MSLAPEQKQQEGRGSSNSNLTSKSTIFQEKLAEQAKKIHELEENIEDQVNRKYRDTLITGGVKKENQEKTQNNTSHMPSPVLFVDCMLRWNLNQFLSDIEKPHSGDQIYLDKPIFLLVKSTLIDKVQKRMNRLLFTRREFKNDEEKRSWKSYVKY